MRSKEELHTFQEALTWLFDHRPKYSNINTRIVVIEGHICMKGFCEITNLYYFYGVNPFVLGSEQIFQEVGTSRSD